MWQSKAHADRYAAEQLFPAFQESGLAPDMMEMTDYERQLLGALTHFDGPLPSGFPRYLSERSFVDAAARPASMQVARAVASGGRVRTLCGDLAGCGPVFLAGQRGSAGGVALPDLGDKSLDGGEGEVRAVAEDGVTRPGKSHEAGGAGRQLAG